MKSPAFQWYPKDILASARVQEMSLAEEGAYRRLLDYCWINGSVPADDKRCARLIGKGATPEMAKYVLEMFIPHPTDPDKKIHERLELERAKQEKNSEARRLASEARWSKQVTPADVRGKKVKSRSDVTGSPGDANALKSDANALQTESIAIAIPISSSFSNKYLLRRSGETFSSIPDLLSRRSSQLLESLKMKYGDVLYEQALKDFSLLHTEKDWEDEDDLRKHFKAYLDKYAVRKDELKTNHSPSNGQPEPKYKSKGEFVVNDK